MAGNTTSDVSNRLSISVPDFDTRLNMGTPDPGGAQPFGYTGFSAHSQFNFFVDIGRVGLYQSNLGSCWQVGGKWLQWSNNDMYMATLGNNTVAADNKVTIAAGAGWGQVTALTAAGSPAESPRLVDYNNLQLHWRVDGVQVALKQFFYGYGDMDDVGGVKKVKKVKRIWTDTSETVPRTGDGDGWRQWSKKTKSEQAHYADPDQHYPGGFLKDVDTFLNQLGKQDLKPDILQAFEWEGDRLDMSSALGTQASYFSALEPFDPYPPMTFTNGGVWGLASRQYASVVQFLNNMHRIVDVLRRIGSAITDNAVGKRIQAVLTAWQDIQEMVNSFMNLTQDPKQWGPTFSSWDGRRGGEGDVLWGHLDSVAQPPPSTPATPASITSLDGPWDITPTGARRLKVDIDGGGATGTLAPANATAVTPAELAAALSGSGWTATVSGASVTVTRSTTGSSSHLKISDPDGSPSLVSIFFGSAPVEAYGTDASDDTADFWDNARSVQISYSSLPEDLRDQFRPIYQAVTDTFGMLDKFITAGNDLMQVSIGQLQPPSVLGLIAKDGISFGTNGPMYGAGGGITFVATGTPDDDNPMESDREKYVLLETLVNWAVDADDPWKDEKLSKFIPDSDIKKKMRGSFRVAAERDVVTTAQHHITQVALNTTSMFSKKVQIISNEETQIFSFTQSVEIAGLEVHVGKATKAGNQEATKFVDVIGKERVSLRTDEVSLALVDDAILLGKHDGSRASVFTKHPGLFIATGHGNEFLQAGWADEASNFYGLDVEGTGEVAINAKSGKTLKLSVQDGAAVTIDDSAVSISKDLKVGTAFTIRGDGTFNRFAAQKIQEAEQKLPLMNQLHGKYSADITKAQAEVAALEAIDAQETAAASSPLPPPDFDAQRRPHQVKLRDINNHRTGLIRQARINQIALDDIGWQPSDDTLFARAARPNPSPAGQ